MKDRSCMMRSAGKKLLEIAQTNEMEWIFFFSQNGNSELLDIATTRTG